MTSSPLRVSTVLVYILVVISAFVFLFPIYWLIRTSGLTLPEIYSFNTYWFPNTLYNFVAVWSVQGLPTDYFHSIIVSLLATGATILMAIPVAFTLSRLYTKKAANKFLDSMLVAVALPPIVLIIPFYILMSSLQLVDTVYGLVLADVVLNIPFSVWLTYSFLRELPISVEESGMLDGCSRLGAFLRLSLPLAVTGLAVTAIFVFINSWNEFLFALVLTRKDAVTAPIGILDLIIGQTAGGTPPSWSLGSAAGVYFMIPAAFLAVVMNRYLAKALTLGAVKE